MNRPAKAPPAAVSVLMGGEDGLPRSRAKGVDRLVLVAIASFADPDGSNCFPSLEGIAERANISVRSVQRAIRRLTHGAELADASRAGDWDRLDAIAREAELEVRAREGGRGRNLYVIRALQVPGEPPRDDAPPVVASTASDATPVGAPIGLDATPAVTWPETPAPPPRHPAPEGRQLAPPDTTPAADRGDNWWRTTYQDHPSDHAGPASARDRRQNGGQPQEPAADEKPEEPEALLRRRGLDPAEPAVAAALAEHPAVDVGRALSSSGHFGGGAPGLVGALVYLDEADSGNTSWRDAVAMGEAAAAEARDAGAVDGIDQGHEEAGAR